MEENLRKITTIWLILGNKCNMNCRYCIKDKNMNIEGKINDKLFDFIDSLPSLKKIVFYGGEPSLYIDDIEAVASRYYGKLRLGSMSNGLFNEKAVDIFNRYEIQVDLSYDGNGIARGMDCFDINEKNILNIDYLWLSGVINSNSYPKEMMNKYREINEKYMILHGYPLKVHLNVCIGEELDKERMSRELSEIFEDGFSFKDMLSHLFTLECCKTIRSNLKLKFFNCSMGTGRNTVAVDRLGNIYLCRNTTKIVGNIDDYDSAHKEINKYVYYDKKCDECIARIICQGGCLLNAKDEKFCSQQRAFASPILKSLMQHGIIDITKE